jgi:thiol:disulfide interchange protein
METARLPLRSAALALLGAASVWLLVGATAWAAAPLDPDPFALTNKADAPARGDKPAPAPKTADRIDFQVAVTPTEAKRGETVRLTITGTPRKGYHTYPLTQRADSDAQPASQLSKLKFEDTPGLKPLWPVSESKPEWEVVPKVGAVLEFASQFTWSQDILILPDATPGIAQLRFKITLQVCDTSCVTGEHPFEVPVTISAAPAVPLTTELKERLAAARPPLTVVPVTAEVLATRGEKSSPTPLVEPPVSPTTPDDSGSSGGLLGLVAAAIGGALLTLLTPCVFPMIPITVSFFLKQSEKEHHNALLMAAAYSLTIVVVLVAAVLLLGGLIVQWANSIWMNAMLGVLLFAFALSLFGMYDLELPSFLTRFTAAREGRGGYVGAFFMALTFTITSFACIGPFLGTLLAPTAALRLSLAELVVGALLYAVTFAAPFFVLALFPGLLKALPRSGGWLNSVKVVMGFLELAAALKFISTADLLLHPGDPWFFNYDTVLCAWIALSVACGLYLIGAFRLPHDSPVEHISVPRMVLASLFLGLAVYITPALWGQTPLGVVGKKLVAFLPPNTRMGGSRSAGGAAEVELTWHLDYEKAWAEATREHKPLFIDFTGVNCTNCRENENGVFPLPAVRQELTKYVRVRLYTDSVPNPALSSEEAEGQAKRNQGWEDKTFGTVSLPLYVIFNPAADQPFEGDKLKGTEHGRYANLIRDTKDFVEFLKGPRNTQPVARREAGDGG